METADYSLSENPQQGLTISEGRKVVVFALLTLFLGSGCELIDWFVNEPLNSAKKRQQDQNGISPEATAPVIRTQSPRDLNKKYTSGSVIAPTPTPTIAACDPNLPKSFECIPP